MSFYLVASEASLIRSHLGWTEDGGCKSREFLRKEFSSRRNNKCWMFGVWERARRAAWQILSFYKRRNWSLILADTNVPIKLILAAITKWPNTSTQEKCVFVYRKKKKKKAEDSSKQWFRDPASFHTVSLPSSMPGTRQMLISGVC